MRRNKENATSLEKPSSVATPRKPKVILFDIECTNLSDAFGSILSIAYKELDEKAVHCIAAWHFPKRWKRAFYDDSEVIRRFYEIVKDADKVIYHFGFLFDQPYINTRTARNNICHPDGSLKFIPNDIKKVDTWILAKKNLKLDRRRLDNIAEALGCKNRKKHIGFEIWKKVMNREPAAQRLMESYNKQDVRTLEAVYRKLRPFDSSTLYYNQALSNVCPVCGSKEALSHGLRPKSGGFYRRLTCKGCGKHYKGKITAA